MRNIRRFLPALAVLALLAAPGVALSQSTRVEAAVWADDELYDTILTPTSFVAPPEHGTDVIYSFMMSGLTGQRAVSEAAPRDRDYNGGRWTVKAVVFTAAGLAVHDADGNGVADFELTSEEQVLEHQDLGHLEILDTSTYFECPLLPRRGR